MSATHHYALFAHMCVEHGLTLLESEMDEIERILTPGLHKAQREAEEAQARLVDAENKLETAKELLRSVLPGLQELRVYDLSFYQRHFYADIPSIKAFISATKAH